MGSRFLAQQTAAVRAAHARGIGCDVGAFEGESLTLVDRPPDAPWQYVAFAMTFGTGTVVSVDPEFREFAAAYPPDRHYLAAHPGYLRTLMEEAARRGREVMATAPGIVFALAEPPAEVAPPPGLHLREVDAAWMNAEQTAGRFENGVGEPDRHGRAERNRYGLALFDEAGGPVAVGGVFISFGLHEIGVDVVRARRGEGLGRLVVAAAARAALERGEVPIYGCAATNIRSQRTALASGFVPVMSDASAS